MKNVDQLLFTWRDGGFRPVAATGQLAVDRGWHVDRATRLCRYDRPPGLTEADQAPVSYGWWTERDTRWVFRRGYLGADPMGRPGNFYAHVLMGSRDDLEQVALAERFGSLFWWDGGELPAEIGPVDLADIPCGPVEPVTADQLASFLAAVLQGRGVRPVVVREPPASAAACMAALGRLFPGAFDELRFSTYEAPRHAADFHIVGMHSPQSAPPNVVVQEPNPDPQAMTFVRRLVSDDPKDRHIARVLHAAARSDGPRRMVGRLADLLNPTGSGAPSLTSAARKLPIADRLDLLRSATDVGLDDDGVAALLGTDPAHLLRIADDLALPPAWRGRALAAYVGIRPDDLASVRRRLFSATIRPIDADLAPHLARALPHAEPLIRMLKHQHPKTITNVTERVVSALDGPERRSLVGNLLPVLHPVNRPAYLLCVLKRLKPKDDSWDAVVATAVTQAGEAALERTPEEVISPVSKAVLASARGGQSAELLAVINMLEIAVDERESDESEIGLQRAQVALAKITDVRRRRIIGQLVLAVLPKTRGTLVLTGNIIAMIQKVLGYRDDEFAELVLRIAVKYRDRSPLPYLAFVIGIVQQNRLRLVRTRVLRRYQLENSTLQELARQAAGRLNLTDYFRAEMLIGRDDQATLLWWTSLST